MKFYITINKKSILLMARAEDKNNISDFFHEVKPGEKFFNLSYEDLKKHGSGTIEIDTEKK